jgi:hypothetical protein
MSINFQSTQQEGALKPLVALLSSKHELTQEQVKSRGKFSMER